MIENRTNHIPEPVMLNGMKHHAGFLADFISNFDAEANDNVAQLNNEIAIIGNSQMDFYTGILQPLQIGLEVYDFLDKNRILDKLSYLTFLEKQGKPYRVIFLSDGSGWVLLPGKLKDRHVHIHPGRVSSHTIRVRAQTLKSAIAILCMSKKYQEDPADINFVNEIRVDILGLPPVKDISGSTGLGKLIGILKKQLNNCRE
jgi:hypothetical protein